MKNRILPFAACVILTFFTIEVRAEKGFATVEEWSEQVISTIDQAYEYYKEENYKEALKWFEKAAAEGNQIALLEIGDLYFFGLGVPVDYKKAVEYYNKSSIKDDPDVFYNMAEIYAAGLDGSKPQPKKAEEYFEKAVQGNSVDAVNLRTKEEKAKLETASIMKQAMNFLNNNNYQEAIPLLINAADKGNTDAMYELAKYYYEYESSIYEAYYWSNLAFPYMRANSITIYNELWDNYSQEFQYTFVNDLYEPSQVALAVGDEFYKEYEDEKALEWYLRAAELDHIDGYYMVGIIYGFSEILPNDKEKAKYYLNIAKSKGHKDAQASLDDLDY